MQLSNLIGGQPIIDIQGLSCIACKCFTVRESVSQPFHIYINLKVYPIGSISIIKGL